MATTPPRGPAELRVARTVSRASQGMPLGRAGVKPVAKGKGRGRKVTPVSAAAGSTIQSATWVDSSPTISGGYYTMPFGDVDVYEWEDPDVSGSPPWTVDTVGAVLTLDVTGYYSTWMVVRFSGATAGDAFHVAVGGFTTPGLPEDGFWTRWLAVGGSDDGDYPIHHVGPVYPSGAVGVDLYPQVATGSAATLDEVVFGINYHGGLTNP